MKIYLAGPIDGCTDSEAEDWRTYVKQELGEDNCLDPLRRDYRGNVKGNEEIIVNNDLDDIDDADIILANCWKPGWGTPMEIFYVGFLTNKPVLSVVPDVDNVSPWLTYFSNKLYESLAEAVKDIQEGVYG